MPIGHRPVAIIAMYWWNKCQSDFEKKEMIERERDSFMFFSKKKVYMLKCVITIVSFAILENTIFDRLYVPCRNKNAEKIYNFNNDD